MKKDELEITDKGMIFKGVEFSNREIEKHFLTLSKQLYKTILKQQRYISESTEVTKSLLLFLQRQPRIFALAYKDEIMVRDMFKWQLKENIKHNQQLIDTICEIEKVCNLPLESTGDPQH